MTCQHFACRSKHDMTRPLLTSPSSISPRTGGRNVEIEKLPFLSAPEVSFFILFPSPAPFASDRPRLCPHPTANQNPPPRPPSIDVIAYSFLEQLISMSAAGAGSFQEAAFPLPLLVAASEGTPEVSATKQNIDPIKLSSLLLAFGNFQSYPSGRNQGKTADGVEHKFWEKWTNDGTEHEVTKLMEEDEGAAMQFLHSQVLCVANISC